MAEEVTSSKTSGVEEHHNTTHKYYPVTKKNHDKPFVKHNFCEHENEGMDTHTHTHRYYPVTGKKK